VRFCESGDKCSVSVTPMFRNSVVILNDVRYTTAAGEVAYLVPMDPYRLCYLLETHN